MATRTTSFSTLNKESFRLLRISAPQDGNKVLHAALETFQLNDAPPYQAMSYEWGPRSPTTSVQIQGEPALRSVRINLWKFLWVLRRHGFSGYLWCDAICINQSDNQERNHQVQMMTQIYRRAQSTLLWIGDGGYGAAETLDLIRELSLSYTAASQIPPLGNDVRLQLWKSLAMISGRRYWTRIWVIQEVTVSQNIEVLCGTGRAPWSAFSSVCQFPPDWYSPLARNIWQLGEGENLQNIEVRCGNDRSPWSSFLSACQFLPNWSEPLASTWSEQQLASNIWRLGEGETLQSIRTSIGRLLHRSTMQKLMRSNRRWPALADPFDRLHQVYRWSECEDARDRVFALLGIARDVSRSRRPLTADYEKTPLETFLVLVSWALSGGVDIECRLSFLRQAARAMGVDRAPDSSLKACALHSDAGWSPPAESSFRLPCQRVGPCVVISHDSVDKMGKVLLGELGGVDASLWLPSGSMHAGAEAEGSSKELIGIDESSILLLCERMAQGKWRVLGRVAPQSQGDGDTVDGFRGLEINQLEGWKCAIRLPSLNEFLQVFLAELQMSAWKWTSLLQHRVGDGGDPLLQHGSVSHFPNKATRVAGYHEQQSFLWRPFRSPQWVLDGYGGAVPWLTWHDSDDMGETEIEYMAGDSPA